MNKVELYTLIQSLPVDAEFSLTEEEIKSKIIEPDKLIWNDKEKEPEEAKDVIGFFNIRKAKIILKALYGGSLLKLSHSCYGNYYAVMNPQRNRINVIREKGNVFSRASKSDDLDEDRIMDFVVWQAGDWYVVNNKETKSKIHKISL